jgi:hypothetical protein
MLEILVVLLLISMLMGIGVGAFSKVGGGPELARSQITEAVRTTRRHAIREKAPAVVLVDPEKNMVTGVGWRSVGVWHFESASIEGSRGFPVDAAVDPSQIAPGGVIGNCLDLTEGSAPGATIPAVSSLNAVTGVSLELFVRLTGWGKRSLIGKGDFYTLSVDDDGRLWGGLKLVRAGNPSGETPQAYQITSDDYTVPQDRWVKVSLHFNGYTCVLSADGIALMEEDFPERMQLLTDQRTPLRIGNQLDPFGGRVDELRIGAAVTGDEMTLPETVELLEGPRFIFFDRDGHLDRNRHTAPVEIVLAFGEDLRTTVTVGLFGEIW